MKKFLLIVPCSLAIFCLMACDKIKTSLPLTTTVVGSNFLVNNNASVAKAKKVLLEEYTGMDCPNCPPAAEKARQISDNLNIEYEKVIVVALHVGGFANPIGQFKNQEFRTDAGEKWYTPVGFNVTSFPSGVINRKDYGNGRVVGWSVFENYVDKAKSEILKVKLNVTTRYDPDKGALNTEVSSVFKTDYAGNVMISALLIEEGITGIQNNDGTDVDHYEFEHVMRGTINGDWGTQITSIPSKAKDTVNIAFNNFYVKGIKFKGTKEIKVNDANVYVVVFAYDAATKEVLQVEKVKIIPDEPID